MPAFVLDSSVALSWFLPDERSSDSRKLLFRVVEEGAWVSAVWPFEIGNALLIAQRRKRLTKQQRIRALHALSRLKIETDANSVLTAWSETLSLADDNGLTTYDASYLELALRKGLLLATFDDRLAEAARKFGILKKP